MQHLVASGLVLLAALASCARSSGSAEAPGASDGSLGREDAGAAGAGSKPSAELPDAATAPAAPSDPAGNPACATDADCRAFSDYCTGCDCRPLHSEAMEPKCDGPGVRCLVDPCQGKVAACQQGTCVLR